jgi:hypothetical protein
MSKSAIIFLVIALIVVPSLVACTPIPGQRPPSNGKPYNGDEPDARPADIPGNFIGVRVHFYGHDYHDFPKAIVFKFNILANAFNPDLIGGFVEPDSGKQHMFRDPATGANLLVEPDPKTTPYGFTVWFPPGEVIDFQIAYHFTGQYGDTVGCEFQTVFGDPIMRTRTYVAVFNVPRDSDALGSVAGSCTYTVSSTDLH